MSDPELDDVQDKIDDARATAKDLAADDVIDPEAVEDPVPRQTDDAADDEQPVTDQG